MMRGEMRAMGEMLVTGTDSLSPLSRPLSLLIPGRTNDFFMLFFLPGVHHLCVWPLQ